jgi:hypothetical protein
MINIGYQWASYQLKIINLWDNMIPTQNHK